MPATMGKSLTLENSSAAWDDLSQRLDAFVKAWEGGTAPPLAQFLPEEPAALRRLVLVELIKVDIEFRWRDNQSPRRLDDYVADFAELAQAGGLPPDLIYEEFHIRRQCGQNPDAEEYCRRYPQQARELRQLLGLESPLASTIMLGRGGAKDIEPGQRLDDFDLLTRLGQGAFASVYLARQISMQRLVALKISADRGSEPQTLAQLDHPHIVRVFDQRTLPERKLRLLYMQHVAGGTLEWVIDFMREQPHRERSGKTLLAAVDHALSRRGESPPSESAVRDRLAEYSWPEAVCWVGARLASALDYAHARGVLHRDIKPANVLVAADGSPKLADFNISFNSKLDGVTAAAYFGGSLAYMSPEQLEACNPAHARQADDLDARSDIYSLGVVLWELLGGTRPLDDGPLAGQWSATLERMTALRRQGVPPEAVRRLPANRPRGLEDVLLQCLAPEPGERFGSARDVARELDLCLELRTQHLLRPGADSWRRAVQRRPFTVMLLAGLAPNVFLSVLNIAYNYDQIIEYLSAPAQRLFNQVQIATVNGVAYLVGISLLFAAAVPILRAAHRVRNGQRVDLETVLPLRRRCLWYGDLVALVSAGEWLTTGVVFPAWIHAQVGSSSTVALRHYLHFLSSQALCGLIAGTLTFFLVTFVTVRFVYPLLVLAQPGQAEETAQLASLARRTWLYFGLSVAAPFLAVILLSLTQTRMAVAVGVLGMVGLAGFILAFFLALAIRADLEALAVALGGPGRGDHAASDSFWN